MHVIFIERGRSVFHISQHFIPMHMLLIKYFV